jgi:hypothetical protein
MTAKDGEEVLEALVQAGRRIGNAITPANVVAGHDATGGHVESLTEAVMGVTAGLAQIAEAIGDLAQAVRETSRRE